MTYKSIQFRFNYGVITLTSEGVVDKACITGRSIKALKKDGGTISRDFGGFIDASNIIGLKKVKLVDLILLSKDEQGFTRDYEIPQNHYVVGAYLNHLFYILLYDGKPKHYRLALPDDTKRTNVVHQLFDN